METRARYRGQISWQVDSKEKQEVRGTTTEEQRHSSSQTEKRRDVEIRASYVRQISWQVGRKKKQEVSKRDQGDTIA